MQQHHAPTKPPRPWPLCYILWGIMVLFTSVCAQPSIGEESVSFANNPNVSWTQVGRHSMVEASNVTFVGVQTLPNGTNIITKITRVGNPLPTTHELFGSCLITHTPGIETNATYSVCDSDQVIIFGGVNCMSPPIDYGAVFTSKPTMSSVNQWDARCVNEHSPNCDSGGCGLWYPREVLAVCCNRTLSTLDRAVTRSGVTCHADEIAVTGGGACAPTWLDPYSGPYNFHLRKGEIDITNLNQFQSNCSSIYADPMTPTVEQSVICVPRPAPTDPAMCVPSTGGDQALTSWGRGGHCDGGGYFIQNDQCFQQQGSGRWFPATINNGLYCSMPVCPAVAGTLHNVSAYTITGPDGNSSTPTTEMSVAQSVLTVQCLPGFSPFDDGRALVSAQFYCDGVTQKWLNIENKFNWNVQRDELTDCIAIKCPVLPVDPFGKYHRNNDNATIITQGLANDDVWLGCDTNYYAIPATVTCKANGEYAGPIPRCVPLQITNVQAVSRFYDYDLKWDPPTFASNEQYYIDRYDFQYDLLFPTATSNSNLAKGVTPSFPAVLVNTSTSYTIVTDKDQDVEHVISNTSLRAVIKNWKNPSIIQYLESSLHVVQPCGCTPNNTLGEPLNITVSQNFGSLNTLDIKFKADSLCANQYKLNGPTSALDLPIQYVDSFDVHSALSCPFLTNVYHSIATVDYRLHGRTFEYCLTAVPERICADCLDTYGVGDDSSPTPPVCVNATALFSIFVSGKVTTSPSNDDVYLSGVPDVNVTAELVDINDVNQPVLFNGNKVTASVITDQLGQYSIHLSSLDVTADSASTRFRVKITPARTDYPTNLRATLGQHFPELLEPTFNTTDLGYYRGLHLNGYNVLTDTINHQISITTDPGQLYYTDLVAHASSLNVNFYDHSQAILLGVITLPDKTNLGPFQAFAGCGVANIIVDAFDESDVVMARPIRTVTTSTQGLFQMSVPWYSRLTIVPSKTTAGALHTFKPSSFQMYVNSHTMDYKSQPFWDMTTNNITMSIAGGKERLDIGIVVPRLYLDFCNENGDTKYAKLGAVDYQGVTIFNVPAQDYTMELQNQDFNDQTTGLQQIIDNGQVVYGPFVPGSAGDRFTFVRQYLYDQLSKERPIVKLSDPSNNYTHDFTVIRPSIATLDFVTPCRDGDSNLPFAFATSGSVVDLPFTIYAEYGTASPIAAGMVSDAIIISDGVTDAGTPLVQQGCKDVSAPDPCSLQTTYNNFTRKSTVLYRFVVGSIELNDHAHETPAYSRTIQYRLASSAAPPQQVFVVITGTLADGAQSELTFPPYEAQYVLRDPPGGTSTAKLTVGTKISINTEFTNEQSFEFESSEQVGPVQTAKQMLCIGTLVAACTETVDTETSVAVKNEIKKSAKSSNTHSVASTFTLTQSIETSDDPDVIDGQGDLFMTISGSALVTEGKTVSVTVTETGICVVNKTDKTPVVTVDPSSTLQWVSRLDINTVIIPQLEGSLEKSYTQFNISAPTSRMDLQPLVTLGELLVASNTSTVINETFHKAVKDTQAIRGWLGLLANDDRLKATAVPWRPLLRALQGPLTAPDNVNGGVGPERDFSHNPPAVVTDGLGVNDQYSQSQSRLHEDQMIQMNDDDPLIGSLTFYGGGHRQSFSWDVEQELATKMELEDDIVPEISLGPAIDFTFKIFGVGLASTVDISTTEGVTASMTAESISTLTNSMEVTLGDNDPGDEFKVLMYRDTKYYSPVYKVEAGQSRCPAENGTVERDRMEFSLDNNLFTHLSVNDDKVRTRLVISNQSPRDEDFTYSLSMQMETDQEGLVLLVDGQPLSSSTAPLQFLVPANSQVTPFVEIVRPSSGYNFSNIKLVAAGVPAYTYSTGHCFSKPVSLFVQYDEPCVEISITDPSEQFRINQASMGPDGSYKQHIELHNPQAAIPDRAWKKRYERSSDELTIQLQYRRVGSGDDYRVVSGSSDAINNTVMSLDSSYIPYTWVLDSVPEGLYEVRAVAQCKMPSDATDQTTYFQQSNHIIARIDHTPPAVFGSPVPFATAQEQFYPGQPFQVDFTEPITCDSKFTDDKHDSTPFANATYYDPSTGTVQWIQLLSQCNPTATSLLLAFHRRDLQLVSGLVVNVTVSNIVDLADNPIVFDPAWSFLVAPIDASVVDTHHPTIAPIAPIPVLQRTNVTLQWQQGQMTRGAPSFVISYHRLLDRTWIDPDMQDILFSANPHYQIQIDQTTSSQVAQAQCIETDSQSDDSPPAFTCSVILLDWMPPSYADYVLASPEDDARITFAKYLATVGDNQWQFDVSQAMPGGDGPARLFDRYSTAFYFTSTPTAVVIKNVSQITPCASCTSPDPTFQVNPYSGTAVHIQWVAPVSNGLNSDRYNDTSLGYQISVQVMGSGATFVLNQWIWDSSVQTAQASSGGRVMHIQSHGHTKRHPIGARSPSSRKGIFVDFAQNPDLAYVLQSLPLGGQVSLQVLLTSNSTVGSSAPASFPIVWYAPLKPAQVLRVEQSNYNVVWYPDTFVNDNSSSLYYTVWMSAPTTYTTFDSSRWSFGYINFANVVYDPSAAYSVQLANDTDYLHLKPIPGYSIFKVRIAIQQTDVMQQFIYSGQVQLVVQVLNVAGPSQSVHNTPFVYLPLPYFYKYWTFHVGNYNLNGYEQTFPFLVADLHVNQLVQLWEQMTKAIMIPDAQVGVDDDKWNFQDAVGMGSNPASIVTYTTTNGDSDTVDLSLVSSLVVDFGDAGCRVEVSRDQMIEHLTNQDVGNVNTDSVASNTTSGVLQLRCLNTTLYKDKLDIVLKNPDIPISSGNEFIFTIGVTLNYFSTVHPFMIQQHKQLTYQATNVGIRVIGILNDNAPLTVVGIDPPQTSDVTASDTYSSDTHVSDPSATISKNRDSSSLTTIVTLIVVLLIAAGVGGFFIARRRAHQKQVNTPDADNTSVDVVVTEQTQVPQQNNV